MAIILDGRVQGPPPVIQSRIGRNGQITLSGRTLQEAHNEANNITPQSIIKPIDMSRVAVAEGDYVTVPMDEDTEFESIPDGRREQYLAEMEEKMREAARKFDFKQAAAYRDKVRDLRAKLLESGGPESTNMEQSSTA